MGDAGRGGTTEDVRAGRKRAQNRVSQQCARERKRVLAQRQKRIGAANEGLADSHDQLHAAYLEVVKENEELTVALLGIRKKLLSLSTAAAVAAGTPRLPPPHSFPAVSSLPKLTSHRASRFPPHLGEPYPTGLGSNR